MYHRQEGNIVRNSIHKKNLENDIKEDFKKESSVENANNNSPADCGNFPLWAIILIILSLLILGVCLIIWVWKK